MKNDKLVLAFVFFLNGLTLSFFVKPWFLGLPMIGVSLFYLIQGLEQEDKSDQLTKYKDKTES